MPLIRIPGAVRAPDETRVVRLGWVRLLLDDIDDIIERLTAHDYDAAIGVRGAKATDSESLKSATRSELRSVVVGVESGSLIVYLLHAKAQIVYRADDSSAETAAAEIASIVRRQRVPVILVWLKNVLLLGLGFVGIIAFLLLLLLATSFFFGTRIEDPPLFVSSGVAVALIASVLLGTLSTWAEYQSGGARVIPFYRRERREASVSQSQAVLIATLSAVLSGAAGSIVTWLITASQGAKP